MFEGVNITLDTSSYAYCGVFVGKLLSNGTIYRCRVTEVNVTDKNQAENHVSVNNGNDYFSVGGIAGCIYGGKIERSAFYGNITVNATADCDVGGLVGRNYGGTVNMCVTKGFISVTSTLKSTELRVGGLVGVNAKLGTSYGTPTITNSYSEMTVYADCTERKSHAYSGGLVGVIDEGTVRYCYAIGTVTARSKYKTAYTGGFAASIENSNVSNSFATGAVYANGNYRGAEKSYSKYGRFCAVSNDNTLSTLYCYKDSAFKFGNTGSELVLSSSYCTETTLGVIKDPSFQENTLGFDKTTWYIIYTELCYPRLNS